MMIKKALIIEDNENNLALITFLLEKAGYDHVDADTGKKGLELAIETAPDFIILDIQLPDMDGTEVLRNIRKNKACADIPVIAMTSYAMSGDKERLLSAGCNGYIEKPFDPVLVIKQIEEILEQLA